MTHVTSDLSLGVDMGWEVIIVLAHLQRVQWLFDDGLVQGGPPLGEAPVLVIPD